MSSLRRGSAWWLWLLLALAVFAGQRWLLPGGEPVATDTATATSPAHAPAVAGGALTAEQIAAGNAAIGKAYVARRGGLQVLGEGTVSRILPDDNEGSRHQRFLLRLDDGRTVLVAHNIDLAPRIGGLSAGERVAFYGVYEWNDKGGVIHWTHHDPRDRHEHGWLRHQGREYR